jgi:hypothetical protein
MRLNWNLQGRNFDEEKEERAVVSMEQGKHI